MPRRPKIKSPKAVKVRLFQPGDAGQDSKADPMDEAWALSFTVRCLPVAQPRQRTRIVTAAGGRTFAQNYTPTRAPVNAFKAAVAQAAAAEYDGPLIEGPVRLSALFLFPRPGRLIWKKRPMPRLPHVTRPDCDNLLKSLADALTGVIWADDAKICELGMSKRYCSGDEGPGVEVVIETVDESRDEAKELVHDAPGLFA